LILKTARRWSLQLQMQAMGVPSPGKMFSGVARICSTNSLS